MKVPENHAFVRQQRIKEISTTLKELYKKGRVVDKPKDFILDICIRYNISIRKAREYYEIAKRMTPHKEL